MKEDDVNVMVCLTIREHPVPSIASREEKCRECDCGVWVTMASYEQAKAKRAIFQCLHCVTSNIEKGEDYRFHEMTAEQLKEAAEYFESKAH